MRLPLFMASSSSSLSSLHHHHYYNYCYASKPSSLLLLPPPCGLSLLRRLTCIQTYAAPQHELQQTRPSYHDFPCHSKRLGSPLGRGLSFASPSFQCNRIPSKRQKRSHEGIRIAPMPMDDVPMPSMFKYDASRIKRLKVSQLKEILDLGGVDHQDCLEKRELVDRLVQTQSFIPPPALKLLQCYIERLEPLDSFPDSVINSSPISTEESQWLEAERNTIRVFQEASPSVVNITTVHLAKDLAMNAMEIPRGTGSGFIWDKKGHIVTNYHVLMSGDSVRVTLADASTWDAKLVGIAKNKDLAVIKIQALDSELKPISVGTSQGLQVGQHVLAIGNPFGLDRTLTGGIISGLGRDIRGIGGWIIRSVIQTDASINPGNSGGPLLDSQGRLIGVNTAIYSPSGASVGVGFAIPIDTVRRVVNQIIRDGKAVRPGIGITCTSDNQAKQLGVVGVLVLDTAPNGAAFRAGIRGTARDSLMRLVLGDVIVAINGQTVRVMEDLLAALDDCQVGETVCVTVKRDNKLKDYNVTLEPIDEW